MASNAEMFPFDDVIMCRRVFTIWNGVSVSCSYPYHAIPEHDCGFSVAFLTEVTAIRGEIGQIRATILLKALQWRHNERDGVSNHQPRDCLLNCLFSRRSTIKPKLRVTGLCEGKPPVTGEFPAQRASNAENASIWWRRQGILYQLLLLHGVL